VRVDIMPTSSDAPKTFVRGVNLGGWLVLERYITPYQFAITDCHVRGDFCWFPGQASAPSVHDPRYKLCDWDQCQPVRVTNAFGNDDSPVDEKTLAQAFATHSSNASKATKNGNPVMDDQTRQVATQWFNFHFENFIQKSDLEALQQAGVTHLRVPLPHWILGDIDSAYEWWIVGTRWSSFVRVCHWARELGLHVWPDVHTAPGSQNGFGKGGRENA
jgi:glucan 1,3-beta-glucosidase